MTKELERRAADQRWPRHRKEEAFVSRHTITAHIVVRDAARAVDWYTNVLGAEEWLRSQRNRVNSNSNSTVKER